MLAVVGMLTGVAALLAPWERMSPVWLHVLLVLGTIQVALAVDLFSDDFSFYYVTVAAYAAYAVRDRRILAAYAVLLAVALLAPLAYDDDTREQAHHILVTLPVFLIVGGLVLYLRDVLERREERYRRFALEAVRLAIRIRGSRGRSGGDADEDELDARLDELAAQAEGELEGEAPEGR